MNAIEPTIYSLKDWLADENSTELPIYDFDDCPLIYQYSKPTALQNAKAWITGKPFVPEILVQLNEFDEVASSLLSVPQFREVMIESRLQIQQEAEFEEEMEKARLITLANHRYEQYLEKKSPESLEAIIQTMNWSSNKADRHMFEHMTDAHSDRELILALVLSDCDMGYVLNYASKEVLENRDLVLAGIARGFSDLEILPDITKNNTWVFRQICLQDGKNLKKGNEEQRLDIPAIKNAAANYAGALASISNTLLNDKDFQTAVLESNPYCLEFMPPSLKSDKEVVAKACYASPETFQFASDELKNDKEFLSHLCSLDTISPEQHEWRNTYLTLENIASRDQSSLEFASPSLLADKEFMTSMVGQDGLLLRCASDELKNDEEVVLAATEQHPYALSYASKQLNNDPAVYGPILDECPSAFHALTDLESMPQFHSLVLQAAKSDGELVQYLNLKAFPSVTRQEIVLEAMKTYGGSFYQSSESDRGDYAFVKSALQINARDYPRISDELKCNRELAIIAVNNDPAVYSETNADFRKDRDITLLAIRGSGYNLRLADESFKFDREICLEAVTDKNSSIRYVDKSLYDDLDIATAFFKGNEYRNPKEYFEGDEPRPEYPKVAAILKAYPDRNPEDAIAYHKQKLSIEAERLKIEQAVPQASMKTTPEVVERPKMRMKI